MNVQNNNPNQNDRIYRLEQSLADVLAHTEMLNAMIVAERGALVAFAEMADQRDTVLTGEINNLRGRIEAQDRHITEQDAQIEELNNKLEYLERNLAAVIGDLHANTTSKISAVANRLESLHSIVANHKHAVTITFPKGGKCSYATTKIGGLE